MSDKKHTHISGLYAIIAALIGAAATLIAVHLTQSNYNEVVSSDDIDIDNSTPENRNSSDTFSNFRAVKIEGKDYLLDSITKFDRGISKIKYINKNYSLLVGESSQIMKGFKINPTGNMWKINLSNNDKAKILTVDGGIGDIAVDEVREIIYFSDRNGKLFHSDLDLSKVEEIFQADKNDIVGIFIDKSGNLWFNTNYDKIVYVFNPEKRELIKKISIDVQINHSVQVQSKIYLALYESFAIIDMNTYTVKFREDIKRVSSLYSNASKIFMGFSNGEVKVFDLGLKELKSIKRHDRYIKKIYANNSYIVVSCDDLLIDIYDVNNYNLLGQADRVHGGATSKIVGIEDGFLTLGEDLVLKIWKR